MAKNKAKATVTAPKIITQTTAEQEIQQKPCAKCIFHTLNKLQKSECIYEVSCTSCTKNITDADNDTCRHWASELKYADSCANCKHCIEKTCPSYDFNKKDDPFTDWACNNFVKYLKED